MTLASLRDRAALPVEWIAARVAAYPKGAMIVWLISLALAGWVF